MLEHLRNDDPALLEQLEDIVRHLVLASELLSRLLAAPAAATAGIAREARELDRSQRTAPDDVDVHAIKTFAKRLDRMEFRTVATALDACVEAVREATNHAESLQASDAPRGVRALAEVLAAATAALRDAVPQVGLRSAEAASRCAEVRRLGEVGDALYYEGVGALYEGTPDPTQVLRWQDVYEKVRFALERCAQAAAVLAQLA